MFACVYKGCTWHACAKCAGRSKLKPLHADATTEPAPRENTKSKAEKSREAEAKAGAEAEAKAKAEVEAKAKAEAAAKAKVKADEDKRFQDKVDEEVKARMAMHEAKATASIDPALAKRLGDIEQVLMELRLKNDQQPAGALTKKKRKQRRGSVTTDNLKAALFDEGIGLGGEGKEAPAVSDDEHSDPEDDHKPQRPKAVTGSKERVAPATMELLKGMSFVDWCKQHAGERPSAPRRR